MKQLIPIYLNWRNDVVLLLGAVALFLLFCDADSLLMFLFSKVLAFAIGFADLCLANYWWNQGKLSDMDITKEDC